jgi:hypothetical protein
VNALILSIASVAFVALLGWVMALWFAREAGRQQRARLLAEARCTDLWNELVKERGLRLRQMERSGL